jgi:hypothetical protein
MLHPALQSVFREMKMTEATYSQARRAMIDIKDKLARDFAAVAAENPVKSVKVESAWRLGFYVQVATARALTKEEKALIPDRHMSVPVRHDVVKPA